MPTYDYRCNSCGHEFEVYQSFADKVKRTCPECKKKTLERLIGCGIAAFCQQEPTTIGQLGERNAKTAGKSKVEEIAAETEASNKKAQQMLSKEAGKKPWWREGDKPLDLKKIKNVKKYIEEGKG
jgi:putative FmdB family regulatory protein